MDLLPVWAVGLSAGAGKGGRNLTRTLTPRNGGTKTYTVKHGDLFAIRAIRPLQIDVLSHPDGGNRYRVRLTDLDQGGKSSHTD